MASTAAPSDAVVALGGKERVASGLIPCSQLNLMNALLGEMSGVSFC